MGEGLDAVTDTVLAEEDDLRSVNERVASLEQANEEVERLLMRVLDAERREQQDRTDAATMHASGKEPYRDLAIPDVPVMPAQTDGAVLDSQQHIERLRVSMGGTHARRRTEEQKESGFFATVGAAVLRALHME